jgi:hypothetical protein
VPDDICPSSSKENIMSKQQQADMLENANRGLGITSAAMIFDIGINALTGIT